MLPTFETNHSHNKQIKNKTKMSQQSNKNSNSNKRPNEVDDSDAIQKKSKPSPIVVDPSENLGELLACDTPLAIFSENSVKNSTISIEDLIKEIKNNSIKRIDSPLQELIDLWQNKVTITKESLFPILNPITGQIKQPGLKSSLLDLLYVLGILKRYKTIMKIDKIVYREFSILLEEKSDSKPTMDLIARDSLYEIMSFSSSIVALSKFKPLSSATVNSLVSDYESAFAKATDSTEPSRIICLESNQENCSQPNCVCGDLEQCCAIIMRRDLYLFNWKKIRGRWLFFDKPGRVLTVFDPKHLVKQQTLGTLYQTNLKLEWSEAKQQTEEMKLAIYVVDSFILKAWRSTSNPSVYMLNHMLSAALRINDDAFFKETLKSAKKLSTGDLKQFMMWASRLCNKEGMISLSCLMAQL